MAQKPTNRRSPNNTSAKEAAKNGKQNSRRTQQASADQGSANRVAQTLLNVEKLLTEANGVSSNQSPDLSQVLNESLENSQNQLSSKLSQVEQSLQEQLEANDSSKQLQALKESLDNSHDQLSSEIAQVSERFQKQLESNDCSEQLQALKESLENSHNQFSSELKELSQSFVEQINELHGTILKCVVDQSNARLNARRAEKAEKLETEKPKSEKPKAQKPKTETPKANQPKAEKTTAAEANDGVEAEALDSSESAWERKKRELFGDYGQETNAKDNPDEAKVAAESSDDGGSEDSDELDSLHDSIESLDEVDADEIDELRTQLTAKLREAEVELSINRAKLDQQNAKLEQQQSELERREKSLAKKYASVGKDGEPKQMGVLDRLSRHLGARKQSDKL